MKRLAKSPDSRGDCTGRTRRVGKYPKEREVSSVDSTSPHDCHPTVAMTSTLSGTNSKHLVHRSPYHFHHEKHRTPSFINIYRISACRNVRVRDSPRLREHAGAARLDGLDLGLAPGETTEARRELGTVKEFTRRRADGTQRGSGLGADTGVEGSATERAVLLGLGPVGSEGVRESTGGRGRVNARSVVHGLCKKVSWLHLDRDSRDSAGMVTYEGRNVCRRSGSRECGQHCAGREWHAL